MTRSFVRASRLYDAHAQERRMHYWPAWVEGGEEA